MTRQEFLDDVTTFDELHSFCIDIGYDLQEHGAYSEEEYNDYIEEDIYDAVRDNSWREMRNWLSSLPDGYDFYFRDDWGEWEGRSYEDIDDLKESVLEYADENDFFDIEDEDVEEEYVEETAEEEVEEEPEDDLEDIDACDMSDFIWAGNAALRELQEQSEKEEAYANQTLMGVLSQLVS